MSKQYDKKFKEDTSKYYFKKARFIELPIWKMNVKTKARRLNVNGLFV